MIQIAVCEDEPAQLQYTSQLLMKCAEKSKVNISVDTYENAEQLLFHREDGKSYDILILDIQMGDMNGIELARKIRETDQTAKIVFLTGIKDYAIEGYEVGAVRYLLKPVKEEAFYELFCKLCKEVQNQVQDYYIFKEKEECCKVLYRDILYIEADGHYTNIIASNKMWRVKAAFSSVEESLISRIVKERESGKDSKKDNVKDNQKNSRKENRNDENDDGKCQSFFLLRRGLFVNLLQIQSIGREDCILENGEKLPISKARYRELNQAFIQFYKNS